MDRMPKRCLNMYQLKNLFSNLEKVINQKKTIKIKFIVFMNHRQNALRKVNQIKNMNIKILFLLSLLNQEVLLSWCMGFKNIEYDGNTFFLLFMQIDSLLEYKPQSITADRGYKGKQEVNEVKIITPYETLMGCSQMLLERLKSCYNVGHLLNQSLVT
jgi:hypothetical protein